MAEPIPVALLGVWHVHAEGYVRSVESHPATVLVGVWDPDPLLGGEAAENFGVPFIADLDELLARDAVEAVVVTCSTDLHVDVIGRSLAAGKHVFTEKLLAPTVPESRKLVAAAAEHDVSLVVSLPFLAESATVAAAELVDSGALGDLTYVRVRMAHDGWVDGWLPERFADPTTAIGGAMSDLGCHPAYLVQRFLGSSPESVSATYTHVTGRAVEDNAVGVARYADGAIGLFEASFTTVPGAFTMELRGTEGSLVHGFGGQGLMAKAGRFDAERWVEVPLPDAHPAPFEQWVTHIRSRSRATENLTAAVELTRIIVAANDAAASGTASTP